ncbi:4Fe-4S binding protein [Candidatus Woesearchaeota archaeon]|nr:4Fe-4S binding protein [Candidatus Woesearchaeota archaeon]
MINKFLRKSWFPNITRIIGLIFFFYLSYLLFTSTGSKIAMFIVWTLWWPMLYITLLFSARAWCGFLCPLSLVNQYGNKLRKGKTINFVKWEFIAYILFFLVIIFEQVSGMFLSTQITLIVFIFLFLLAFIMGLLFQRHSFCNIVCPIGAILGIFSRLSFIGVRVKKNICKTCRDKPYKSKLFIVH